MRLFPLPSEQADQDSEPAVSEEVAREAVPPGPLLRVAFTVAYDGTAFHGFARQPRQRTVGGELAAALAKMADAAEPEIVCAGRTDSGVHASGQVVHADLPAELVHSVHRGVERGDLSWIARSLTRQLSPEIAVRAAVLPPDGFDARHSAEARRYRYSILNAAAPDPLLARTAWHVETPLDLPSLRLATDAILGSHDFAGFCRRSPGTAAGTPITRRVLDARWVLAPRLAAASAGALPEGGLLHLEIEANAFRHQMVRSLVGTLVSIGTGRRSAARIGDMLRSGDRRGAPAPAPAAGLCLVGVRYPPPYAGLSSMVGAPG